MPEAEAGKLDAFGHVRLGGIAHWLEGEIERPHRQGDARDRARPRPARRHADRLRPGPGDPLRPARDRRRRRRPWGTMTALRGTEIELVQLSEATAELKTVPESLYAEAEVFFGWGGGGSGAPSQNERPEVALKCSGRWHRRSSLLRQGCCARSRSLPGSCWCPAVGRGRGREGATVTAYVRRRSAPRRSGSCAARRREPGELRVRVVCLPSRRGSGKLDLATAGANARRATEDSTTVASSSPARRQLHPPDPRRSRDRPGSRTAPGRRDGASPYRSGLQLTATIARPERAVGEAVTPSGHSELPRSAGSRERVAAPPATAGPRAPRRCP